jgi:hypothetical protein
MAAARRQAAGTRSRTRATAKDAPRLARLTTGWRGRPGAAWRALRSSVAAPVVGLLVVGLAMIGFVALVAFVTADEAGTAGATDAQPLLSARERNLETQLVALRVADCGTLTDLAAGHAGALELPAEERLAALAALAVGVPEASGGALEPGLAHLRLALEHDVAAAAWQLAGEPGLVVVGARTGLVGDLSAAGLAVVAAAARTRAHLDPAVAGVEPQLLDRRAVVLAPVRDHAAQRAAAAAVAGHRRPLVVPRTG